MCKEEKKKRKKKGKEKQRKTPYCHGETNLNWQKAVRSLKYNSKQQNPLKGRAILLNMNSCDMSQWYARWWFLHTMYMWSHFWCDLSPTMWTSCWCKSPWANLVSETLCIVNVKWSHLYYYRVHKKFLYFFENLMFHVFVFPLYIINSVKFVTLWPVCHNLCFFVLLWFCL